MTSQNPVPTAATVELRALARIVAALERLDHDAQVRAVAWVWERYMGSPHVVAGGEAT